MKNAVAIATAVAVLVAIACCVSWTFQKRGSSYLAGYYPPHPPPPPYHGEGGGDAGSEENHHVLKCIQCGELGQGQCPTKGRPPAPRICPKDKDYGCEKCINEYGKTTRRCVGPNGNAETLKKHKCDVDTTKKKTWFEEVEETVLTLNKHVCKKFWSKQVTEAVAISVAVAVGAAAAAACALKFRAWRNKKEYMAVPPEHAVLHM